MIYILTKEYNEYDQFGSYFIHAWQWKPTIAEMKVHDRFITDEIGLHLSVHGGGRIADEDVWFHLEIIDNERFKNE
ncbi:hypothetical protein D3C87_324440 [compost metagenome]